jgi:hypothetical protein
MHAYAATTQKDLFRFALDNASCKTNTSVICGCAHYLHKAMIFASPPGHLSLLPEDRLQETPAQQALSLQKYTIALQNIEPLGLRTVGEQSKEAS